VECSVTLTPGSSVNKVGVQGGSGSVDRPRGFCIRILWNVQAGAQHAVHSVQCFILLSIHTVTNGVRSMQGVSIKCPT
jgi:hypothetical protein